MPSIFSRIVTGEIPCYRIAETDHCLAFLDINPIAVGHILVIPKKEVDYIFDLEPELYQACWDFARTVAEALKKAIPCEKVGVAVVGLEVPHAHIHLVPMNHISDLDFTKEKLKLSPANFQQMVQKIQSCL